MMAEFVRKLAIRAPLALVFATSMAVAETAVAQTAAAIVGQVVDQSGATLPGVTVTATSPALQVPRSRRHRRAGRSTG